MEQIPTNLRGATRGGSRRLAGAVLIAALLAPSLASADEQGWGPMRVFNVTFDVLIARPAAVGTLLVGAILFPPAAVLSSPNGRDTIEEAYERFITGPGENVWGRPLGEF